MQRKTEAECKPVCVCREVRKGEGIKTHTHICGRCNKKKRSNQPRVKVFGRREARGEWFLVPCSETGRMIDFVYLQQHRNDV